MDLDSQDLLTQIGNTPLLKIVRLPKGLEGVEIYAKAEWFNPGGSVKDRAALWMVEDGERSGQLTRETVILDATSGNTGIALAMIGAVKGYRVELVMPQSASEERKKTLRAYGAEIRLTDPLEGSDGAILEARRLYAEDAERYFYSDQYNNPANPQAHYETTGLEIVRQTKGRVTHFVAGIGTGGTIMGTGRRLKEYNEAIQVIAVEPDSGMHGLEGLKHMEGSIVPGVYDEGFLDGKISVGTEEAYKTVWWLATEEGLLVGPSSGAALRGALEVAREIGKGMIVTIFPDGGDRYLGTPLWHPK
jgi:cysteine synthase B